MRLHQRRSDKKCFDLKINIVVFDGYAISTKDTTRELRSGKMSHTIEINDGNFLPNYVNRQNFVNLLFAKLGENGFKVILCSSDADTTIVKTTFDIKNGSVTILADDTDILCLLLHHVYIFHED